MPVCLVVEALSQRRSIDQVTVVRHTDAVRAVDVEGLSLRVRAATSSRVSQVAETHVAGQVGNACTILEDPGSHAVALALVEASTRAAAHDTGSILSTVLEQVQRIVYFNGCRG